MRIHIHGNCQGTVLKRLLLEADPQIEVTSREVHSVDLEKDIEDHVQEVKTADVILLQPVNDNYRGEKRLSSNWVKINKRPDAQLLMFVPLHFNAYFPELGYLHPHESLKMPYFDYNICFMYARGLSVEQTYSTIMAEEFYDRAFLDEEYRRTMEELHKREAVYNADIKITDIIDSNYKSELLFFTQNHPTRALASRVANRVLEHLGRDGAVSLTGPDYLDNMIVSPYPTVLRWCGLDPGKYRDLVRASRQDFSWAEYVEALFAHYAENTPKLEMVNQLKASPEAVSYFERVNRHRQNLLNQL